MHIPQWGTYRFMGSNNDFTIDEVRESMDDLEKLYDEAFERCEQLQGLVAALREQIRLQSKLNDLEKNMPAAPDPLVEMATLTRTIH